MKVKAFPQEFEAERVTERHVGIENELRYNGTYDDFDDCDCNSCREQRAERETYDDDTRGKVFSHPLFREWHTDGGGREFTTIPIRLKSIKRGRGERYLTEYYEFLKAETVPISSGGTHIHISILDSDHENLEVNATALAVAFYDQFTKIAGRRSNWAPRINANNITAIKEQLQQRKQTVGTYQPRKRAYGRMMTMLNPTSYQTLEWRGPKGSNDCTEIRAWIDFIETVVNVANKESIDGVKFKSLLRTKRVKEYVKDMFTPEELNMKVNVNALIRSAA